MDCFLQHPYKRFCFFIFFIFTNRDIITNTNLILVIVLRPKDVLRTKNSVIAVFPCVSEKNYPLKLMFTYNCNKETL